MADERSVDVNHPTDQPAPHQTLDALITEAFAATRVLPTIRRCEELDRELRAQIERLVPIVQAQADHINRGEPDWYSRQRLLDNTTDALAEDLGSGLMSAAMHVQALARHCAGLARYAGGR